jgi:chromodomain-helicase-DNA-binding protein 4
MGLGKTIQAIAFLVCMKNEKLNSKPVLVIAPKSTLPGWDQVGVIWSCKVVGFIGFM